MSGKDLEPALPGPEGLPGIRLDAAHTETGPGENWQVMPVRKEFLGRQIHRYLRFAPKAEGPERSEGT